MGNRSNIPLSSSSRLTPLPGQGANDPAINRLVSDLESIENIRMLANRGVTDRGREEFKDRELKLLGVRLAEQAASETVLLTNLRKNLYSSHIVSSETDADVLIRSTFEAFSQIHQIHDLDNAESWIFALNNEFRQERIEGRRRGIGETAQQLENDPIFLAQMAWEKRIDELANELGLDWNFVEEFLITYESLSQPNFPGRIDPRGVPFIQLEPPLVVIADQIKDFIPVLDKVIPLYEAYTGNALLTGQKLKGCERILRVGLVLAPHVIDAIARPAGRLVRRGVRLISRAITSSILGNSAKQMARLAIALGIESRSMLRFCGRLARLSTSRMRTLYRRIQNALKLGKSLQISKEEARLIRDADEAFGEISAASKAERRLSTRNTATSRGNKRASVKSGIRRGEGGPRGPKPITRFEPYINNNPKATPSEKQIGETLDKQAQQGKLRGIERVKGAPESKIPKVYGKKRPRSADYLCDTSEGKEISADLVQTKLRKPPDIVRNVIDEKSGQADVLFIQAQSPKVGSNEAMEIAEYLKNTPNHSFQRVIILKDTRILLDANI